MGWPVNGVVSKKEAKRIKKILGKRRVSGGYFVQGYVNPTISITAKKRDSAAVKVLDAGGNLVHSIPLDFSGSESRGVGWNGMTPRGLLPTARTS